MLTDITANNLALGAKSGHSLILFGHPIHMDDYLPADKSKLLFLDAQNKRGVLMANGQSSLLPNEALIHGQSIVSDNSNFRLTFQTDGNLVLYQGTNFTAENALWATDIVDSSIERVIMQLDGNLVLYRNNGSAWASNTNGNPSSRLTVQDDGNLIIYKGNVPIWALNSVPRQLNLQLYDKAPNIAVTGRGFTPMNKVIINYGYATMGPIEETKTFGTLEAFTDIIGSFIGISFAVPNVAYQISANGINIANGENKGSAVLRDGIRPRSIRVRANQRVDRIHPNL